MDVDLYPGGDAKTRLGLQHSKLADQRQVADLKQHWKQALEQLKRLLQR